MKNSFPTFSWKQTSKVHEHELAIEKRIGESWKICEWEIEYHLKYTFQVVFKYPICKVQFCKHSRLNWRSLKETFEATPKDWRIDSLYDARRRLSSNPWAHESQTLWTHHKILYASIRLYFNQIVVFGCASDETNFTSMVTNEPRTLG